MNMPLALAVALGSLGQLQDRIFAAAMQHAHAPKVWASAQLRAVLPKFQ